MSAAPPLRFLGIVIGGWIAVRAAVLVPDWSWADEAVLVLPAVRTDDRSALAAASRHVFPRQETTRVPPILALSNRRSRESRGLAAEGRSLAPPDPRFRPDDEKAGWALALLQGSKPGGTERRILPTLPPMAAPHRASFPSRWAVSAWALVRSGRGRQLAPGGTLGGSQAGARITYRLRDEGLFLSGRVYAPLNEPRGAEAALGIEWQPLRALPVRLLAERRQTIGDEGRSAFALLAHGGVSEQPVIGPVRLDAYAQAGVVGAKSRDAFVDGAVRLGLSVADDLSIGVGVWGAAQPGAERLDVGPQLSWRLPAAGERIRLSADWRVRLAGDARPGSGPALTLATDF